VTLRFDGRLTNPEVREIARTWAGMAFKPPGQRVKLDLTAVTTIDGHGEAFLQRMHEEGNVLVSGSTATKAVVDEIVQNDGH
jgi:hypothetical protein